MNKSRLWVVLAMVWIGLTVVSPRLPMMEAQAPTKISQTTFPFRFSFTSNGAAKVFTVSNLGQAAHTIAMTGSTVTGCALLFQGSNDNSAWTTLASGIWSYPAAQNGASISQGQYTFFRLAYNLSANTNCTGQAVVISYVGYQFPLAIAQSTIEFLVTSITTPVYVFVSDSTPVIVSGLQCYNPNASVAYVELFDSPTTGSAPTLSATTNFVFGIPASVTTEIPTHNLKQNTGVWIGAATTYTGVTAVSSAISCSVQVNPKGPFL